MNAHALQSQRTGALVGDAAVLLARAPGPWMRTLVGAGAVLCGGFSWFVAASSDAPAARVAALVLAAIGVALLWGCWFSRLVVVHAQATQDRTPGVGRAIGAALAIAALTTVVVPALLLAIAGVPMGMAAVALLAAACVGLLLATVPKIVYLMLCFAPLVAGLLARLVDLVRPTGLPPIPWAQWAAIAAWLVPVLVALTAWRWHRIARGDGMHPSVWWQPAVLAGARPGAGEGWFSGGMRNAGMPDFLWPAGQVAGAAPDRPVRAMRALLGTPFAPLSGAQILVQVAILVLVIVYVSLEVGGDAGQAAALASGAIIAGGVMVLMFGQRLEAMYTRRSTELDEMALMPGFGESARQRATLLRALGHQTAFLALALFALMGWTILRLDTGLLRGSLLLLACAGTLLPLGIACLRPVAGLRMNGWRMVAVAGPVMVLALFTAAFAGIPASDEPGSAIVPPLLKGLLVFWVLVFVVGAQVLSRTLRRIRARPHPFLSD